MSAQDFSIRRATAADTSIITMHRRAMFEDMRVGTRADHDAMDVQFGPWVRSALERGIYIGWFVETDQGKIVAGAGLSVDDSPATPRDQTGRRSYVMNVYTDPGYRHRGLARRLMGTILDWCRSNGIHTIGLHASDEGRPLYESLGFQQTNEMRLTL
jgi:GNAT superfamily N-acetyltransferase